MNTLVTEKSMSLVSPVMTKDLFSERSGLRPGQVRGQAANNNLPMVKVGRLSLVNVAALGWNDLLVIPCPAATQETFANASGLTKGQVQTQLEEENLPKKMVGRLMLVDVAELYRRCLSKKPELEIVQH